MRQTYRTRSQWRDRAKRLLWSIAFFIAFAGAGDAWSYSALRSWDVTATGPFNTVTWGFADDGTWIPANGTSDLVGFLDGIWSVSTTSTNLTQRPWFSLFEESFDRWSQLSGLTFVYESADDGASLQTSTGVRGLRADIRIGGKQIDGLSGALASTWLPDTGDMIIDTADSGLWSNALNNSVKARNLLMHEIGHGLGLMHVSSSDTALLMESYISTAFDGPQLDDIRGIHSLYGDRFEKAHKSLGNGVAARATNLGPLSLGGAISVGGSAVGDQYVGPNEVDFVSITSTADVDYFSFTVTTQGVLSASLTPWGGTFSQGPSAGLETIIDASSENNLSLAVLGPGGSLRLADADRVGAGDIEVLTGITIPSAGTYYVRVQGVSDAVQFYELDLALNAPTSVVPGDFNGDGVANGADFVIWQRNFGATGQGLTADANGDGRVDAADLGVWQTNFGRGDSAAIRAVPEPSGLYIAGVALVFYLGRRVKV